MNAGYNVTEAEKAILQDGWERPHEGEEHRIEIPVGQSLAMDLAAPAQELRMVLDPDFSRESISPRGKIKLFSIQMHIPRKDYKANMPATLARRFAVLADGKEVARFEDNHEALIRVALPDGAKRIEVRFDESWGNERVGVYAFDVK